jgi:hypothetical protein
VKENKHIRTRGNEKAIYRLSFSLKEELWGEKSVI